MKSKGVGYLLFIFLGALGAHHFTTTNIFGIELYNRNKNILLPLNLKWSYSKIKLDDRLVNNKMFNTPFIYKQKMFVRDIKEENYGQFTTIIRPTENLNKINNIYMRYSDRHAEMEYVKLNQNLNKIIKVFKVRVYTKVDSLYRTLIIMQDEITFFVCKLEGIHSFSDKGLPFSGILEYAYINRKLNQPGINKNYKHETLINDGWSFNKKHTPFPNR